MRAEFARAFRLHEQGKLREAFLRYDAILKAAPTHAPALHYSGVVLYQSGKLPAAVERIRASIAVDPGAAEAWANLAIALKDLGHDEAALNGFREAARLEPGDTKILANLAGALLTAGHFADAEATSRQLLARDGNHGTGWFILALALQPQGRMLEALDAAGRAAGLAPEFERHAGLKAQIELGIGAPDKARQTLEKALARHPMSAALRFELPAFSNSGWPTSRPLRPPTSRCCASTRSTVQRCRNSRSCGHDLPTGMIGTCWSSGTGPAWPRNCLRCRPSHCCRCLPRAPNSGDARRRGSRAWWVHW